MTTDPSQGPPDFGYYQTLVTITSLPVKDQIILGKGKCFSGTCWTEIDVKNQNLG